MQINHEVLASHGPVIASKDRWEVREMELSPEKLMALWEMMQRFPTLFSDFTKDDIQNWVNYLTDSSTYWLELYENGQIVGLIYFDNIQLVIDAHAHIMIFDRQISSRTPGCKLALEWMFEKFPLNRLTVEVPSIYYATIRHALRLGFKIEGKRRMAVTLNGRYSDVILLGILRSEINERIRGANPDNKQHSIGYQGSALDDGSLSDGAAVQSTGGFEESVG